MKNMHIDKVSNKKSLLLKNCEWDVSIFDFQFYHFLVEDQAFSKDHARLLSK